MLIQFLVIHLQHSSRGGYARILPSLAAPIMSPAPRVITISFCESRQYKNSFILFYAKEFAESFHVHLEIANTSTEQPDIYSSFI